MGTPAPSLSAGFYREPPRRASERLRDDLDLKRSPQRAQARLLMGIAFIVLAVIMGFLAAQAMLIVIAG